MKANVAMKLTIVTFLLSACAMSGEKREEIGKPAESIPAGIKEVKTSNDARLRKFSEHTLSNGLHVLLVKDQSLPFVTYQLMVKTGYSSDPAELSGLNQIVASMLEKGTQKRNANQISDELALIGADFEATVDADYTYLLGSGLSFNREPLLDQFIEIVTKPSFAVGEIDKIKRRILDHITQLVDEPNSLADIAFDRFLYGSHPYSKTSFGTKETVRNIHRSAIIRHFLQYYRPNNSIMAVTGNYSDDILQQLEIRLKDWKPRPVKAVSYEPVPKIEKNEVRFLDKSDLTQAQIRVGQEGIPRTDKAFLTLRIANTILGQGFSSRLVDQVRDNLGLTYHISSDMDAKLATGDITISTFTRNNKVGEALTQILNIFDKFVADGVTPAEVASAKGQMLGNFGRSLETSERVAFNLLLLRYFGISDDYLSHYQDSLEDISVADVNRTIKTYFHPGHLKILVYANKKEVLSQLDPWKPIEIKEASDLR